MQRPTLRKKRGHPTLFDFMAAETVSVAPYRPGDVVRYRTPKPSPSGQYWSSAHGIGVISARGARADDYDTVIYSIYDGCGHASMLQAEHIELLLRPDTQIRRRYTYKSLFDLTLGPGFPAEETRALCTDAWRLWVGLDRRLRCYTGLAHLVEHDAARRERIKRIQDRAERRALRRLEKHNQVIDTTIPRMI
jgi:hypothetical protein